MSADLARLIREMTEDLERAKKAARIWDEVFDIIAGRTPDREDGKPEIHPLGLGIDE